MEKRIEQVKQVLIEVIEQSKQLQGYSDQSIEFVERIRNIVKEFEPGEFDEFTEDGDLLYKVYRGNIPGIRCIYYNKSESGELIPQYVESDYILIEFTGLFDDGYEKPDLTLDELAKYLLILFVTADCTDCCNAVKFIKMNNEQVILMEVNSGKTYHS